MSCYYDGPYLSPNQRSCMIDSKCPIPSYKLKCLNVLHIRTPKFVSNGEKKNLPGPQNQTFSCSSHQKVLFIVSNFYLILGM